MESGLGAALGGPVLSNIVGEPQPGGKTSRVPRRSGRPRRRLRVTVLTALAVAVAPATSGAASATWYVSPTGTGTSCATDGRTPASAFPRIQQAIDCAANGDAIEVGRGKYAEVLTVSKDLSIIGAGQSATRITSRGVTRELPVISTAANVAIDSLKILSGWGGGIVNVETLKLNRVSVVGLGRGYSLRGITSSGTLVLRNSVVRNHRIDDTCGAGISSAGVLTVVKSAIRSNSSVGNCAGGIGIFGGQARITRSEITGNYADLWGGGIFVRSGTLTVTHTTIDANIAEAGGGLANMSSVVAWRTRFLDNGAERVGGGIWNIGASNLAEGSLILRGASLVTSNIVTSGSGGGIFNDPGATVSVSADSSVRGNTPDDCVGC